jgi:glycosyltransferase involved in cell wall biosynthesis
LENKLKVKSKQLNQKYNIETYFTGFINQSEIVENYLVLDTLVLPSRKQGETWGLVANEGLQAGCSVIVSDSVGSHKDFINLERFRVCETENAESLAKQIEELFLFEYKVDWAQDIMLEYSIEKNAISIVSAILNK